jgi:hypothetical protein
MNDTRQTRTRATRRARFYGVTPTQAVTSACWGVLFVTLVVQALFA